MSLLLARRRPLLFPSAAAADVYAAEVLADSPIAYWRFNETSGATVADEIGGIDATVFGADLSATGLTATGSAASFDGTDDKVSVGVIPAGDPLTLHGPEASIEVLAKWSPTADMYARPFDKSTSGFGADGYAMWFHSGNVDFTVDGDNSSGYPRASSSYQDENWHHFVVTIVGTTAKIYEDGVEIASGTTNAIPDAEAELNFGAWSTGDDRGWGGSLDEIAFYDTALSGARILAHAQAAGVA